MRNKLSHIIEAQAWARRLPPKDCPRDAIALAQRLGISLTTLEAERVVLAMPFRPDNVTVGSVVHGGAIATLVDIAGAAASASGSGSSSSALDTAMVRKYYLDGDFDPAIDLIEKLNVRRGYAQKA